MTRAAAIFVLALSPVCSALAAQTQGAAFFKAVRDSVKISRNSEPLKIARNSTIPAKGLKISVPAGELLGVAFSNGVSAVAVESAGLYDWVKASSLNWASAVAPNAQKAANAMSICRMYFLAIGIRL